MDRDAFTTVAEVLYGDGAYELVTKARDNQTAHNANHGKRAGVLSPLVTKAWTKEERQEFGRQVGQSTNLLGAVAGPAAFYSAYTHRKEGGIPRDLVHSLGPKMARSKVKSLRRVGTKATNAANTLDRASGVPATKVAHAIPKGSRKAKLAATAAAAGLVGLQGVAWAGDTVPVTPGFRTPIKSQKEVNKAAPDQADLHALHVPGPVGKIKAAKGTLRYVKQKAVGPPAPSVIRTKQPVAKSEYDLRWDVEFAKRDDEKRQVFGWASIVEMNGEPVVDLQGDFIPAEEIEKAAYEFVQKSRKGGDMHRRDGDSPYSASEMIESFMVTDDKKQAMGLPSSVPTGWWVGFAVHDDATWQLVKDGKRTGFSIHGRGKRDAL